MYNDAAMRPEFYREGFNPMEMLRLVRNDDGTLRWALDAEIKQLWFRLIYPNGRISSVIQDDGKGALAKARIYLDRSDAEEQCIAEGSARRASSDDPNCKYYERYYVDSAETAAVSRALSRAGFDLPGCNQVVNGYLINPVTGEPVTEMNLGMLAGQVMVSPQPPQTNIANPATVSQSQEIPPHPYSPLTAPNNTIQAPVTPEPRQAAPCQPVQTQNGVQGDTKLENAKNITIPRGKYAGRTLGEIAQNDPKLLEWYATMYQSSDTTIRDAAQYLINQAMNTMQAS